MSKFLFLLLLTATVARAADVPPGRPVAGGTDALQRSGAEESAGRRSVVPIDGRPFDTAVRLEILGKTKHPWSVQLSQPTTADIRKGDALAATFYLRGTGVRPETGEAATGFVVEQAGEPYDKSIDLPLGAGREWKKVQIAFRAAADYPPGGANVIFRGGFGKQAFEVGGFELIDHGPDVDLATLPDNTKDYPGRAADAAWRKAADARIEKLRKTDLTVKVLDASGRPVAGAAVHVKMTRHAFHFGTAVAGELITSDSADAEKYRQTVLRLFNSVVMENDLKWPEWNDPAHRARTVKALHWLHDRGLFIRGHNLVWPTAQFLPPDIAAAAQKPNLSGADKAALQRKILDHIAGEVSATRGLTGEWDVVNEAVANHLLQDVLGPDAIIDWYRAARAADPSAKLFYNDYKAVAGGFVDPSGLDRMLAVVKDLQARRAPLDGIGAQGHFGRGVTPPETVLKILDRFAALGLPIEITEFDVNSPDDALKADYLRDFYTACFSHPAVNGIVMWGFWEGRHWMPDAALFAVDWTPRANAKAYEALVLKRWWTDEALTTAPDGTAACRGFLGDYAITATAKGRSETVKATLAKGSGPVEVRLGDGAAAASSPAKN